MRNIKIKQLDIVNFKGIRSLNISFAEKDTIICGDNGTGKTSVFDAFLWVLFGKDSTGRSDSNFNIKTLDKNGKPLLKLEHSVSVILSIDGEDKKFQRVYGEKWTKPRGTTEEVLTNHQTEFYLNDVKLSTKKEYDAEISSIFSEDVFRMVTNPFYFTSLKADEQKTMLLNMVGDISDDDIAAGNKDFSDLLAQLSGRSLYQFKSEVSAKKKAVTEELKVIPSQIEMVNKLMPEAEDWETLNKELIEKQEALKTIDNQLSDKSKISEQEANRRTDIQRQIGEKKISLVNTENRIRENINKERNDILLKIQQKNFEIKQKQDGVSNIYNEIEALCQKIKIKDEELEILRKEFYSKNKETLVYPEDAFICPTCKRPLEVEDIEAKQREMQENFNLQKAESLKNNKEKGFATKREKDILISQKEAKQKEISEIDIQIKQNCEELKILRNQCPENINAQSIIDADNEIISLKNDIIELENRLSIQTGVKEDLSELSMGKETLNNAIQEIYQKQAKKVQIEKNQKEITELEQKRVANNQKLADLEKLEYTAMSFQKAKDNELMRRINGLFSYVSFSFITQQLNGGEKLTCFCSVNGVPYSDVNDTGKLNAGLDIIQAISLNKGIQAPIMIDNAEKYNHILETIGQKILLKVSNDKELTIK